MTGKLLLACALTASAIVPAATEELAHAQGSEEDKEAALAAYKKGNSAYTLAQWDKAIQYFTQAFELYPDAAFLFNLAQTHRQADNCKKASFFYNRYLATKPDAPNRSEVEDFIRDLDAECERRASTGTRAAGTDPVTSAGAGEDTVGSQLQGGAVTTSASAADRPAHLVAYASMGPSLMSAGDLDLPARSSISLSAGYPLHLGRLTLDLGALASVNPVSWEVEGGSSSGTVFFTSLLVNAGLSMDLFAKVRVRAELGVGMMLYSGLGSDGNPFRDPAADDGSLRSLSTRVSLGAEYGITDSLAVFAQPIVFSFSPAPEALAPSIDNVQAVQAVLGVGYKI